MSPLVGFVSCPFSLTHVRILCKRTLLWVVFKDFVPKCPTSASDNCYCFIQYFVGTALSLPWAFPSSTFHLQYPNVCLCFLSYDVDSQVLFIVSEKNTRKHGLTCSRWPLSSENHGIPFFIFCFQLWESQTSPIRSIMSAKIIRVEEPTDLWDSMW